jgi:signal transduction histidine kinase
MRAHDGRATLEISDQGPGIEPEQLERIFERFYTHRQEGAERGGAGIGLAIARAIANDHDGQLRAGNQTGGGATFTLVLPILDHADDGRAVVATASRGHVE